MTLWLPKPEGDSTTVHEEIRDLFNAIREYRAHELSEDVEAMIHDVAMDSKVSESVVAKIKTEAPACRQKYFSMSARLWGPWAALIPLSLLGQFLPRGQFYSHAIKVIAAIAGILALEWFILEYFGWRTQYRDSYIANFLIRTLEFGLGYQSNPMDERFRDGLAQMIQRTAVRYALIYKKSDSTRFFAAQVRRQARNCRNDIMTLVPGLVIADQAEVATVNENLARLLIRTQTGYWHQTSDIAKHGMPMKRGNAVRIAAVSFIRDRSIQVAFIALAASAVAAVIGLARHF